MRVSRLYVPSPLAQGEQVELAEESAHYVRTVLRLKQGDAIVLFNGNGGEFHGLLSEVSRKTVLVRIGDHSARSVESFLNVKLGLGISRGDRMDWVVQKAVELGVDRITPIMAERCVVQLKGEKKQLRLQHWQKIAQHAAEQSGRTQLPSLLEVELLQSWISGQQGLKLFLDPYAEQSLTRLQPIDSKVTLLTGPEGGFTERERDLVKSAGFIPVRLGSRILRTETASIAALAAVQTLWGDFASEAGGQRQGVHDGKRFAN
jgi:16S rRNA (uracil1498-N3)-methyltransferase